VSVTAKYLKKKNVMNVYKMNLQKSGKVHKKTD